METVVSQVVFSLAPLRLDLKRRMLSLRENLHTAYNESPTTPESERNISLDSPSLVMLLPGVGRVGDPAVHRLWLVEGVGRPPLDWRGERPVQHRLGDRGQVVTGLLPPSQAGDDQVLLALA